MKHLVFVVNPRSGTDRVKAIEQAVAQSLRPPHYRCEIRKTERPGHGTEIAREAAAQGAFAVVAVGGDGSVNDVATGLLGTNTALAVLPKGSGNGFARTLRIPLQLEKALERLRTGTPGWVDVGVANGKLFLSNAGVAFDALVSRIFAGSTTRGLRTYSRVILRHLFTYKPRVWQLNIDGQACEEHAFMVVVANGRQFGYNFQIAPEADYTDGLLNLVIIRKFPFWAGPFIALDSLRGRLSQNRFVHTRTAAHIEVRHPRLHFFQTDGDAHECQGTVHFRVQQKALRVLY